MSDPVIDRTMAVRIATQLGWEPKREWVGLTKEECFELCVKHKDEPFSLVIAVQDKLKDKNNAA